MSQDCEWFGSAIASSIRRIQFVLSQLAGYDEGYVETVKGTGTNSERGHGPLGTAIRTGKPCWTRVIRKGEPVTVKLSNDVVREIIMIMQGELLRRDATQLTELADRLPAVAADRVHLQQVLFNLMMNALDAMSAMTDRPRVLRIRTDTYESAAILVALRDSGVWLTAEQVEQLFEALYTTKPEGMCLGLSISRGIVETRGGRLWTTPNDGPGATFQFTLPIEQGGAA